MRNVDKPLKLNRKALVLALMLGLASGGAIAQSTTGGISGSVAEGAGKTVLIENASGFSREVAVDERGRYSIGNLPLGTYKVTVKQGGNAVESRENIGITIGRNTDVSFGAAGSGVQTLDVVSVTGARVQAIDVTSVDTRTVVTAQQLQQLPLARNAEAIALLAPGVVNNSGGFDNGPLGGSLASFGGSAATENAYYLNGFNSTDPFRNLGGLTLPYGAIDQQEVFTGGYGAQYGRSNGGVINQVGKRGSNEWHFGAAVGWEPDSMKAKQKDIFWRPDSQTSPLSSTAYGFAKAANGLYQPLSETESNQTTYSAYVGGPILKDRLFFFLAAEQVDADGSRILSNRDAGAGVLTHGVGNGDIDYEYKQQRWYAKLDWYITDNHLLEFTGASDEYETSGKVYSYDYVNRERGAYFNGDSVTEGGPTLYTGKYTGYFGDDITVTAQYGRMSTPDKVTPFGYDPVNGPRIIDYALQNPAYNGGTSIQGKQKVTTPISLPDREYKKENLRLNLDWRIGNHDFNIGIDHQKAEGINTGSMLAGPGYSWTYGRTDDPMGANSGGLISLAPNENGGRGAPSPGLIDPTYGSTGYYVTRDVATNIFSYNAEQKAYYVEDKWQATDRLLLILGLRGDKFTNFTPFGQPYVETDLQLAPRLGFSWDVHGDSSLKVYGNLGRYYLGLPLSPAGLFTPQTLTTTYFTYSGINADGTPIISQQLGSAVSANSRFGRLADVRTAVVKDLEGENQDEIILGFTKQLESGWVAGVRATHRRLNAGVDDQNVDALNLPLVAAAAAQGVTIDFNKNASASLVNPGADKNVFRVIGTDGQLHEVTVTRAAAGFPEFKRNYSAVEFNLERPFDGKWYTKFNYVWSHSNGTTEGQLRSDLWRTGGTLGSYQGQASVSTTQSWDHAALMEHFNGDQSNDHRHQLKLYGYYQLAQEWGVSANLSMISGAPRSCLGYYNGDNYPTYDSSGNYTGPNPDPAGYGGSAITGGPYHFCRGEPSPPGSHGRLGWINQLDLGVSYKPRFAKGVAVNFNVFNVTNEDAATNIYPFSSLPDKSSVNPLWNQPVNYQTPRYARLTISYDY